jgi:hypothetical protein
MEADWEFEISRDAPVIDAHWAGFVDIRAHPECASSLPEVAHFPTLAETLIGLNSQGSPVWTSKCDFWSVNPEEFFLDADELDAPPSMLAAASACYMDLLACLTERWENPDRTAQDCATLCASLHSIQLRCCRADFVIRKAVLAGEEGFGVTAYFTACGSSKETSKTVLAQALHVFVDTALAVWIR